MSDHASHETTAAADAPLFSPAEVEQFAADDVTAGGAIGKMLSALFLYTVVAMSIAGWWTCTRVAWEREGKLGAEVGYQIRFDDHTSVGTRICFVTEGILLRWLQDDPSLSKIGAVVFDEFHERNLLSDVALALVSIFSRPSDRIRPWW